MMWEGLFSGWLSEPHVMTILFTWFVQGVFCYSMFVLPYGRERKAQAREAAEAKRPTAVAGRPIAA
ncbi:MAG: hypothetical protein F9K13_11200 [Candidatus Methylomirabilis oxygeniifera]|uniref:Uncharacterized protein n=1 Tax=Methylomirabilis oxygeniifera TaxID=671143 RepID=D5MGU5_METO1|nr:MAG: hypothetical protein F9K13_11200 [Candidatus Methylomirabilis oxyfera]CBE68976.1 protein of unknown function [Candidatus Methylomirabilis oxyfera]